MEEKEVLDILKRARRALDALSQVEILDDWKFDSKLEVWFLHLSIAIEHETSYFPQKSQWYIVVESKYPRGKIKVYPDVKNSINVTLYHQANNSGIEKNGLWRKGALCLEVNTLPNFQSEPFGVHERLLYHVKRATSWLELVAKGMLVSDNEPFELPEFTLMKDFSFAFSEDVVTFMQWESTDCWYGMAELDVYKNEPLVSYVTVFKSLSNDIVHNTQWGNYLSQKTLSSPILAPWILLKQPPVLNVWQAPETIDDLLFACSEQGIDFMDILQKLMPKIRDGKRHLLLLGFPIPKVFGGESEIIFWQALYLPVVSHSTLTAKGYRANEQGWWMRDKFEVFTKKTKLEWIWSENWNQHEISQRGKMDGLLQRKSILIIGAGCIGASMAEILVRSGIYSLTICDLDIFEIGNLSRHTLNINDIGESKENSLCNHLNMLTPYANVKVISRKLDMDNALNTVLDKYDIIIDCTGSDSVIEILQSYTFNKKCFLASVSVGLGAKHLYVYISHGTLFNFDTFNELIYPYLQKEKDLYDNFNLPRDGTGCWHPTFPGRIDDIWFAAATSVKVIEGYIMNESETPLSLIYEQKYENGVFEGYYLVNRKENE